MAADRAASPLAWRRGHLAVVMLVVAVVLALLACLPGAQAAPVAPAPPSSDLKVTEGQVTTAVDDLAPEIMAGGEDLVITGTIANGTTSALVSPVLVVQVQTSTSVSVTELGGWLAGTRDSYLQTCLIETLPATVEPGATVGYTITVPAGSLPLGNSSQWGPRGVQVSVTQDHASLAKDRTYLLWSQADQTQPTKVLVAVPITATPAELTALATLREPYEPYEPGASASPSPTGQPTATQAPTQPQASASPSASPAPLDTQDEDSLDPLAGLLARTTALLSLAQPGVVLGVDPALLTALGVFDPEAVPEPAQASPGPQATPEPTASDSASPGQGAEPEVSSTPAEATETPTPTPGATSTAGTATPEEARQKELTTVQRLRSQLELAIASGDVAVLPWADADEAALAHAAETSAIKEARDRADASGLASLGARTDLAWPASKTLDEQTLESLPQSSSLVLAPPGAMDVSEDLTYTPSGLATVGHRVLLLSDPATSFTLRGVLPPGANPSGERVSPKLSALDSRQLLRAQTAVVSRQLPTVGRYLTLSLDRPTAIGTDPGLIQERVAALFDSEWVTPVTVEDMRNQAEAVASGAEGSWPHSVQRKPLTPASWEQGEISAEELAQARNSAGFLRSFSQMVSDPAALLGQSLDVFSWATSAGWRTTASARGSMLAQVGTQIEELNSSLVAQPSATVNLISEQANLPVRVVSSLDQDATIQVTLTSSSTRLQPDGDVTTTVPAGSETTVLVPVKAVGSGDVQVTIHVQTPDGVQVGTPAVVHMRVHAEWESLGTRLIVGVLILLLLVGIARTVRHGRRGSTTAGTRSADTAPQARPSLRKDPV